MTPRAILVALVAVASLLASVPHAGAAPAGLPAEPLHANEVERPHPALAQVPVDSSAVGQARAHLASVDQQLRTAEQALAGAVTAIASLQEAERRLVVQLETARVRAFAAGHRLEELRAGLESLAVEAYVRGGQAGVDTLDRDARAATERGREQALVRTVTTHHREEYLAAREVRDHSRREIARADLLLAGVRHRLVDTDEARRRAEVAVATLTVAREEARRAVEHSRLTAPVLGTDFTLVALDAYWRAAARLSAEAPECRMRWEVLAGVGRVESRHGTWRGSSLDGEGNTTEPIIGIPLNGERNTAVIRDTDGGLLDGDPVWDRAVGPMQFIPSSWRMFGSDATGDGTANPHNIYDAAEAAARLLCWASSRYDSEEGLRAGLIRYNRSQRYVEIVVGYVRAYDALELPIA